MPADTDMPKYRLHEDADGKHLYYAAYNVRVATFARGVPVSERERIVAALSASPAREGEAPVAWNGLGEPPGQGRVSVDADHPLYKAFKPSREAIALIEKDERANVQALNAIRDMMVGHVSNWPEPRRFGTALFLIDKTLHTALSRPTPARARPYWNGSGNKCWSFTDEEYQAILAALQPQAGEGE